MAGNRGPAQPAAGGGGVPLIGLIPAGGVGTRLAPYPGPKELLPVGWQWCAVNGGLERRPKVVSQYVLEHMVRAGAGRIVIVVGEHKHDLLRYYGSGRRFQTSLSYVYQEQPRGMARAVDLARPWLAGARVLFGMPDTIVHPRDAFRRLVEAHVTGVADLTLGLFDTDRPEQFGMVALDEDGWVVAHVDKPRRTTFRLMWGCAVWEPRFTDLIHEVLEARKAGGRTAEVVLGDAIDEALRRGLRVAGHLFDGGFYADIGTYDGLVEAQARLAQFGDAAADTDANRSRHPSAPRDAGASRPRSRTRPAAAAVPSREAPRC